MLICNNCGELRLKSSFENVNMDLANILFPRETPYEHKACGGEFVQTEKCKKCGTYIPIGNYEICNQCVCHYFTLQNALSLGNKYKESIDINGFLAFVFKNYLDELEGIILNNITQNTDDMRNKLQNDISKYCAEDIVFFKEWLKKWNTER